MDFATSMIPLFTMASVSVDVPAAAGALNLGALADLLNPIFAAAKTYASVLVPSGTLFLALAFVLEAFTLLLQFVVKGGATDMIAKGFRLLVVSSIPLSMLTSWPELPNILITFFCNNVSSLFTHAGGDGTAQIAASITHVDAAVTNMFASVVATPDDGILGKIYVLMAQIMIAMLLFVPVLLMTVAMMFALYGPMLMLWLGIIFGPILVCWLPWEPMGQLCTKWFNFIITMGLAFAIGICMCALMTNCLSQFATTLQAQGSGADKSLAALCGLIPMLAAIGFIGYMMLKVEHIAAAMVGGPAIGGGAGFFGFAAGMAMRGLKPSAPPKSPNSPPTSGTGGASGGAAGGTPAPSGTTPPGSSTPQLSSQAAHVSGTSGGPSYNPSSVIGAASLLASGASRAGAYSPMTPRDGSAGRGNSPAMNPLTNREPPPPVAPTAPADTPSETPSRGEAFAETLKDFAADSGKSFGSVLASVASSGPAKLSAFGVAALAGGPIAAVAVGAYAVSPALRGAVNKTAAITGRGAGKVASVASREAGKAAVVVGAAAGATATAVVAGVRGGLAAASARLRPAGSAGGSAGGARRPDSARPAQQEATIVPPGSPTTPKGGGGAGGAGGAAP